VPVPVLSISKHGKTTYFFSRNELPRIAKFVNCSFSMKQLLLVPNLLTLSRIVLIIPSIYFLEKSLFTLAAFCVLILLLTDFFDGYFARKLNQTSQIGAILDPVADKLVVIAFFTHLLVYDSVAPIYVYLVFTRNILQLSSIPILLVWKKIQFKVKPKKIPKIGTALNFIILGLYEFNFVVSKNLDILNRFTSEMEQLNTFVLAPLLLISMVIEIYILFTFIPRFYKIYRGTHDTFE
jgi:phosphatidylglycerophosphate synthase